MRELSIDDVLELFESNNGLCIGREHSESNLQASVTGVGWNSSIDDGNWVIVKTSDLHDAITPVEYVKLSEQAKGAIIALLNKDKICKEDIGAGCGEYYVKSKT